MKAAVVEELGRPPVYADFADPVPRNGAVVATVAAAALKHIDRILIAGTHYASPDLQVPMVAGQDGVARLDDGRLVYTVAIAPFGLMAQRTLVDPSRAVELPAGMDPLVAAAIPNPGLAAFYSLEYGARVQAGQNLLVLGATGVAGSVAVQLAKKKYDAGRVVVVGRNAERLAWLRLVGADEAISPDAEDYVQRLAAEHKAHPFDVILDYVWGPPAEGALTALNNPSLSADFHATRFVQMGALAGPTITLSAGTVRSSGVEILGLGPSTLPPDSHIRFATEFLPALFAMANDGTLIVDRSPHPLSEVEALWTATEPSGTRVVLVP